MGEGGQRKQAWKAIFVPEKAYGGFFGLEFFVVFAGWWNKGEISRDVFSHNYYTSSGVDNCRYMHFNGWALRRWEWKVDINLDSNEMHAKIFVLGVCCLLASFSSLIWNNFRIKHLSNVRIFYDIL
jgi:hypothetical protein